MSDEVQTPEADESAPAAQEVKKTKVRRQKKVEEVLISDGSTLEKTEVTEADESAPESVTLAAPYAFYDEEGKLLSWAQGQTVADPAEIAVLIERGAVFGAE